MLCSLAYGADPPRGHPVAPEYAHHLRELAAPDTVASGQLDGLMRTSGL